MNDFIRMQFLKLLDKIIRSSLWRTGEGARCDPNPVQPVVIRHLC